MFLTKDSINKLHSSVIKFSSLRFYGKNKIMNIPFAGTSTHTGTSIDPHTECIVAYEKTSARLLREATFYNIK